MSATTESGALAPALARMLLMPASPAAALPLLAAPPTAASAVWLANRELRQRARHDRLPFGPRQRRTNQGATHWTFLPDPGRCDVVWKVMRLANVGWWRWRLNLLRRHRCHVVSIARRGRKSCGRR
jgi:hypothetical protein